MTIERIIPREETRCECESFGAKLIVTHEPDKFDSRLDVVKIIDASEQSLNHPQGPLTLATINSGAFAPHIEHALELADLLARAPEMFEALRNVASILGTEEIGSDVGKYMTCHEANTLADAIRLIDSEDAEAFLSGHALHDEEGDEHYKGA